MTTVFLTSGTTWAVPPGVSVLTRVDCYGGGAPAGAGSPGLGGTGGYGGSFARNNNFPVTPGSSLFINVAGANGDSWVNKVANVPPTTVADGVRAGGAGGSCVGDVSFGGGAGGAGQSGGIGAIGGGGGGAAGPSGGGSSGGQPSPGAGGGGSAGAGGSGGASPNASGTAGNQYGGGGGGGASGSGSAGPGAQGLIIIEYTASSIQNVTPSVWAPGSSIPVLSFSVTVLQHVFGGGLFAWGSAPWSGTALAGQVLSVGLVPNVSQIHALQTQPGVVTLSPALWLDPTFIRMPQVGFAQVLDVGLVPSQNSIKVPTLAPGTTILSPGLWPNQNFIPTLGLTIAPEHFVSETFYAPTITVGEFVVSLAHYDAERTYYPPSFVLSGNSIQAELVGGEQIPDHQVLYQPPDPVYLYPIWPHSRGADYSAKRRPERYITGRR